jgi:hypothetical protein
MAGRKPAISVIPRHLQKSAASLGQHHGAGPLYRKRIPVPQAIGLSWSSDIPDGICRCQVHRRTTASAGQYEPGHRPPATPPPPPPRRQARHQLEPPAAFRIPASRAQLRRPRAAVIGHLHTDKSVSRADRDRDCPARITRPAMPDTIAEQLAHQQGGVISARVPGTEHPDCERAGDPPTLRQPGKRHALPDHRPDHQRTRPSRPHYPGGKPPGWCGHTGMHARLRGSRQAGTRNRRVRGRPRRAHHGWT